MINRRDIAVLAAGALGGLGSSGVGASPTFPSKPLRIVVQYQAGGSTDTLARLLAEPLAQRLGQTVLVENKPGAAGIIGTDFVAKAEPDGHTLLLTIPAPITGNMALFKKLPYDPRKELRMVSDIARTRTVLTVNADVPATDVASLLALIKASPKKFAMGSWGPGTQPHQIQVFIDKQYGLETLHIPYKGEAPMVADLVGGTVQMTVGSITTLAPHIASGKLRPLAVTGRQRAKGLHQISTFAEQGYKDDVFAMTGPTSLMAPARTPNEVVARVGQEVQAIIAQADMQKRIEALGAEPMGNSPEEAAKAYAVYWPVVVKLVSDTGVTLD